MLLIRTAHLSIAVIRSGSSGARSGGGLWMQERPQRASENRQDLD